MKEYIEKQELDRLPIVTQADLESQAYNRGARAFAEKLKEKIKSDVLAQTLGVHDKYVCNRVDELLKELGVL